MINFRYEFSKEFIERYNHDLFDSLVKKKAKAVLDACYDYDVIIANKLSGILSNEYLEMTVFCNPEDMISIIIYTYNEFPLLVDRYNPSIIYKSINIKEEIFDLDGRNKGAKDKLKEYKDNLIVELGLLRAKYNSFSAFHFIQELSSATKLKDVKRIFKIVYNTKMGGCKYISCNKERIFPKWLNDCKDIFDYDFVSEKFGYELIEFSGLKVCPYCNEEDIRVVKGVKKYRPDIDHFYPKSKYPFLAVSLNNFIPSGGRCNSAFKKEVDMIDGYLSPLLKGVSNDVFFDFKYNNISNTLTFEIIADENLTKNINLFEVKAVYSDDYYKELYEKYNSIFRDFKGLDKTLSFLKDPEKLKVYFDVKPERNLLNTRALVYQYDALNSIFSNNLVLDKV